MKRSALFIVVWIDVLSGIIHFGHSLDDFTAVCSSFETVYNALDMCFACQNVSYRFKSYPAP